MTTTTSPLPDEITAAALKTLLTTPSSTATVQLLDVRTPLERLFGTIKPSAHIPLGALETPDASALLAKQNLAPAKRTIIFCASGVRSLRALAVLRANHGFTQAQSLHGGLSAWKSA